MLLKVLLVGVLFLALLPPCFSSEALDWHENGLDTMQRLLFNESRGANMETPYPLDYGDYWFWTDDNAKDLEALADSPGGREEYMATLASFLDSTKQRELVFRRVIDMNPAVIKPEPEDFFISNHYYDLTGDLSEGTILLAMDYHDTRQIVMARIHWDKDIEGYGIEEGVREATLWMEAPDGQRFELVVGDSVALERRLSVKPGGKAETCMPALEPEKFKLDRMWAGGQRGDVKEGKFSDGSFSIYYPSVKIAVEETPGLIVNKENAMAFAYSVNTGEYLKSYKTCYSLGSTPGGESVLTEDIIFVKGLYVYNLSQYREMVNNLEEYRNLDIALSYGIGDVVYGLARAGTATGNASIIRMAEEMLFSYYSMARKERGTYSRSLATAVLGALEIYSYTGEERYLEVAEDLGDMLLEYQNTNPASASYGGFYVYNHGDIWGDCALRAASVLYTLYEHTGREEFRESALKAKDSIQVCGKRLCYYNAHGRQRIDAAFYYALALEMTTKIPDRELQLLALNYLWNVTTSFEDYEVYTWTGARETNSETQAWAMRALYEYYEQSENATPVFSTVWLEGLSMANGVQRATAASRGKVWMRSENAQVMGSGTRVYLSGASKATVSLSEGENVLAYPVFVRTESSAVNAEVKEYNQSFIELAISEGEEQEICSTPREGKPLELYGCKLNGSAFIVPSEVILTRSSRGKVGQLWYGEGINDSFTMAFDFRIGGGSGGDGLVFMFYKDKGYKPLTGGTLGFGNAKGYGIEFDTWENDAQDDPSGSHIALIEGSAGNHRAYSNYSFDDRWHRAEVEVRQDSVAVSIDNKSVLEWDGKLSREYSGMGFSASTGGSTDWHMVRDIALETGGYGSQKIYFRILRKPSEEYSVKRDGEAVGVITSGSEGYISFEDEVADKPATYEITQVSEEGVGGEQGKEYWLIAFGTVIVVLLMLFRWRFR